MGSLNLVPVTADDYRRLAEKRLPRQFFDYIDSGSFDERTLARNTEDFRRFQFAQRVMHDVSHIDTKTRVLGEDWTMPLALAPIGLGGLFARRAEVQAKKAADNCGVPFCLSTVSVCSMEEVAKVSEKPFWFQLYMLRDRAAVDDLMQRAKAAGVKTLVFTIDLAVLGARYNDFRNGLSGYPNAWAKFRSGPLSFAAHPKWAYDVGIRGRPLLFGNLAPYVPKAKSVRDFTRWVHSQHDPSVTWGDIEWLRSVWDGKLVLKGILSGEDAVSAARAGADAIIVSNHGGRQLDDVSSTIALLPKIMQSLQRYEGPQIEVLIDGGIRNGQDVLKALALGAKGTLMGRSWVYALAARGQKGLEDFLGVVRRAMVTSMGLTGVVNVSDINSRILEDHVLDSS